ncbi:uncharacterized protein LOC135842948 [Planococcus citri]|uniref:uncharacterized protein LOC135842948 n=1 Tax=Planococcus citri TaxID=170843 RepID=UPI0031F8626A
MFVKLAVFGLLFGVIFQSDANGEHNEQSDKDLTVVISFESFEIDAEDFFKKQLDPVFNELSKCVTWHFVPCSCSRIVDEVLQCVNGVGECQIDVLYACAAHYYENDQIKLGNFFICMMTDSNKFIKGEWCAKKACLDWNLLKACKPSEQAGQFCNNRYKQLQDIHAKGMPGVIFNWRFNEQTQAAAQTNLKSAVCERLQKIGKTCDACSNCSG